MVQRFREKMGPDSLWNTTPTEEAHQEGLEPQRSGRCGVAVAGKGLWATKARCGSVNVSPGQ
jgi:hypothetical protein